MARLSPAKGYGPVTTEILDAGPFYFAEDYHQQYLAKNPSGYCGLGGTGVSCQIGVGVALRNSPRIRAWTVNESGRRLRAAGRSFRS